MADGLGGRFENKVALIAGGANAVEGRLMGFGGVCAWRILREGGRVVIGDIDDATGEQAVSQMRDAGFEAEYRHLDVTSESDWQAIVKLAVEKFGRLDILINAAGTQDKDSIEETSVDDWTRTMDVTNRMMFLGTRAVAPEMRRAGGGSIVNISSMAALWSAMYASAYGASRAGMIHFTHTSAVQLGADNIRVNAVMPGWVRTPFTDHIWADDELRESRDKRVPMGRWGTVEEIANGILFLVSDDASYVSGTELLIDGATSAWVGPM